VINLAGEDLAEMRAWNADDVGAARGLDAE
jgi:hypothetical protein